LIRQDEYHKTYLPVISAIERYVPRDRLVMSEAELWFGLWQDHTVLNDSNLGSRSGLRPDAFVMDPVFRDLHERDRRVDPATYQYVQGLIDRYQVIYQDNYSEIYVTKGLK
jgi:hypothetical protein